MRAIAVCVVAVALACTRTNWREVPTVSDLSVPQPCSATPPPKVWNDSLPLISDTAQQHLVGGSAALAYPADLRMDYRAGMVRARFAIDTMGHVIPGSGVIEASSDPQFAKAVCYALPRLRFEPVVVDGRKTVVHLVHVPFTFTVR